MKTFSTMVLVAMVACGGEQQTTTSECDAGQSPDAGTQTRVLGSSCSSSNDCDGITEQSTCWSNVDARPVTFCSQHCDALTGACPSGNTCHVISDDRADIDAGVCPNCAPYVFGFCFKSCASDSDCPSGVRCDSKEHACDPMPCTTPATCDVR